MKTEHTQTQRPLNGCFDYIGIYNFFCMLKQQTNIFIAILVRHLRCANVILFNFVKNLRKTRILGKKSRN